MQPASGETFGGKSVPSLRVLMVHRDAARVEVFTEALAQPPVLCEATTTHVTALVDATCQIAEGVFDAALLCLDLDGCSGLDAFVQLQAHSPDLPTVIIDAPDGETGVDAVDAGAQTYYLPGKVDARRLQLDVFSATIRQNRRSKSSREVALLENLLHNIPDRIYFKDLESRFTRVNPAVVRFHEFSSPDEMIGKTDADLFSSEHVHEALLDEQRLMDGEVSEIKKVEKETFMDGRVSWSLTTKMPLRSRSGEIMGTFGISHDVTKLHETEMQLENERNLLTKTTSELLVKNEQLELDLSTAREIQLALLPRDYPCFPEHVAGDEGYLNFDHRYIPAQAVGGDFFTVHRVGETCAGVLICDVMGHGPRAAMVTGIIRALCEELSYAAEDPAAFLGGLNSALTTILRRVEDVILCTAFYMVVDSLSGEVRFANAGHPSPVHVRRSVQEVTSVKEYVGNEIRPVMGLYRDAEYVTEAFTMQPGDVMLLYTDGLYEVLCDDGQDWGEERLLRSVKNNVELRTRRLLDVVLAEVMGHAVDGFDDDVCILSVERNAGVAGD